MTYFMNIEGSVPKGKSPLEKFDGGDGLPTEGWFSINSFMFGASRAIGMDVGEMHNKDSGSCLMHEFRIDKPLGTAYQNILSLLLEPGAEGNKLYLIGTKPERAATKGPIVYLQVTLEGAQFSYFCMSGQDGIPTIQYHITYNICTIKHWHEEGGEFQTAGPIVYDIVKGSAESTIKE